MTSVLTLNYLASRLISAVQLVTSDGTHSGLSASGTSSSAATRLHQISTLSRWQQSRPTSESSGQAQPDVRKFMREREHLRRLRVGAIDENQRRKRVEKRKAAELLWIELASIVVHDDAAAHDENAQASLAR